jgi:hypothetical protein
LEVKVFLPTVGKSAPAADCFVSSPHGEIGEKGSNDVARKKNSGPKDDVVVLNIEVEHFFG